MRRARAAALTVLLLAGAAACTGDPQPTPPPPPRPLGWTAVALPGGADPLLVRSSGSVVLVAARTGGRAALYRLTPAGATAVPLEPRSVYAPGARWVDLATDGPRVLAIGRASGGAHGIARWTVWSGTPERVAEHPQPFETFGGPRAGGLAAVALGAQPVLVGTWDDGGPGLDTAVWHRTSATAWERMPAQRSLASSQTVLPQPAGAAAGRHRLVVVGSTTDLGGKEVVTRASAWSAPAPSGPWERMDLAATTTSARATAVACTAEDSCWVVGLDGGHPALWLLPASGGPARVALPGATAVTGDRPPVLAVDGSRLLVALADGTRTTVLSGVGGRWTTTPGPAGVPVALATWPGHLAVVTDTGTSPRLWIAASP